MKLIKSSFELWYPNGYDLDNLFKFGEKIGRVCYKSEDKITDTSYIEFMNRMKVLGHGSVLEHIPIYLKAGYTKLLDHSEDYENNKYTRVNWNGGIAYISTNYRVILENGWESDLEYMTEPLKDHEERITVHFTCSRDIWNEFIRHRSLLRVDDQDFSFSQESTRYCNYSKDKFGGEVTFISPSWEMDKNQKQVFKNSLRIAEDNYLRLLEMGWKPQQARIVLPGATKTELIMTGFADDWKAFFNLRNAKSAHPDAYELAHPLYEEFINRNIF